MGRIRTGFRLLAQSSQVVRKDPELIAVMLAGFLLQLGLFLALFFAVFQRSPELADFRFPRFLWLFPILVASGMPGILANATVLATAMRRLEGRQGSLGQGFALAVDRFPQLVLWSIFAATVGLVIQLIAEKLKFAGRIAAWIAGASWVVVTMLVVPVLLFEPVGVIDAIKRSASLIKRRWGEGVTGYGAIVGAMFVLIIPVIIVGVVVVASVSPIAGMVVIAAGSFALMMLTSTLQGVFNAALYRFAADGVALGPFERAQLEEAFHSQERKKTSPGRRAWRIAGLVLLAAYAILKFLQWQFGDQIR